MTTKPIIALDFPDKIKAQQFLQLFKNEQLFVKVGMELFYQEGIPFLRNLKDQGHDIFLDLKLHDIPNTVYSSMKVLASLGVDMVNVHAAGGVDMMKKALLGLEDGTQKDQVRPRLIAVTQLTSTSETQMQKEQLISCGLTDSVLHYARQAYQAGLDGVVCSAMEAGDIRDATNKEFIRVTPGIRLAGDDVNDQKRVLTPRQAREQGSSFIVVGRSITKAADPVAAYEKVKNEWEMDS